MGNYSSEDLERLLDIVSEAIDSWVFYPEDEYGTAEALIPTDIMVQLSEAYEKLGGTDGKL